MKKLFTLFVIMSMSIYAFAQSPQKMSYQAVIRDAGSALITSHAVGMRISILQGSASGTVVYTETQTPTTNANGLVSIEIGGGTGFNAINWASGPYFLKIETDPTGGTNYTIVGTSQLLSVPYALYSKTSESSTDAVTITGNQTITGIKTFSNDLLINGLTVGLGKGAVSSNSAVGYQALYSNTTGYKNMANGFQTLYSNTTGNQNTANGGSSLYSNTTGGWNTANGYSALYSNSSGSNNTADGRYALWSNTIGITNTAVGEEAMYSNTSGNYNTANGDVALWSNTTGNNNTAIGFSALYSNITGQENTANGSGALYSNTTGYYNTAIGINALIANTTGNNNTAIGYQANVGSGVLTNATAIGNGASVNSSNKVRIGNSSVTVIEGQVNWSVGSDRQLKDNIEYSDELGLEFVKSLKTVTFTYKNDLAKGHHDGLIAQDVKQVLERLGLSFSGLIESDNEEKTMNLAYAEFVIPLINAVQEQQKQIDELKQLVKSLIQK